MRVCKRRTSVVIEHARDIAQDFAELFGGANECSALMGSEGV